MRRIWTFGGALAKVATVGSTTFVTLNSPDTSAAGAMKDQAEMVSTRRSSLFRHYLMPVEIQHSGLLPLVAIAGTHHNAVEGW